MPAFGKRRSVELREKLLTKTLKREKLKTMRENKRKYLRFEYLLPVEKVKVQGKPTEGIEGKIENVSRDGLGLIFNLGLDFEPGVVIDFKTYNPETGKESQVKGEIVWSKLAGNKTEIGLKIVNMERRTKAALLELGFNLWRDKKTKSKAK